MWPLLAVLKGRRRRQQQHRHGEGDVDRPRGPTFDFPTITMRRASGGEASSSGGGAQHDNTNNTTSTTTTMPLLYTLARSWAWTAVAFRCHTHPHEASTAIVDHRGDNVLHWAAFGNPTIEVVQALLQVCPALVQQRNHQGLYPLHVAASYRASASVIRLLVDAYPAAAGIPNRMGSYPIHLMCDYGTTPVALRAVLQHAEAVSSVTQLDPVYQRRPVHILNGRKNMIVCQRTRNTLRTLRRRIRRAQQQQAHREDDSLSKLRKEFHNVLEEPHNDCYALASMLLVVEATQQPLSADADGVLKPLSVLRAALCTEDCPATFQEWTILRYADYLHLPLCGDDGRLALHMAVSPAQQRSHIDTALVLDLLEACPTAAGIRDAQGNLPLHLALQRHGDDDRTGRCNKTNYHDDNDHTVVVWALINAHPEAMTEVPLLDEIPSLTPYLWSRLTTRDALFRIIRASGPRLIGAKTSIT